MTVAKFLDLSTKYVHFEDIKLLIDHAERAVPSGMIVIKHNHGWFIHVELDPERAGELAFELTARGFSSAFINVLRHSREHDCWWVNLDADGEDEEGLPTFDW
jgi:hypothetical protein